MISDAFVKKMFLIFFIFLNEFFCLSIIYTVTYIIDCFIFYLDKGEFGMKKTLQTCVLSLSILLACSAAAYADGNAFTPLNFDDTAYGTPIRTSSTTIAPTNTAVPSSKNDEPAGNAKMQNAIIQLDNAQVDVRNELLNYKSKYADVDAQYTAVKAERKALDKQIKSLEKRIKKIDQQKENIRKNMI